MGSSPTSETTRRSPTAETAGLEPVCCGFKSLRPDQRIYFATRLKRANSTNIAAEFRASQVKQALYAGVAQW